MSKSQIDSTTLVAAIFAAALGLTLLPGPFEWLASIGGLVLLLILLSYDQQGYRSWFQSVSFSAVCGFCCAVASGAVLQLLAARGEVHLGNGQWSTEWMPIGFIFATAVFLGIDRVRMSGREPVEMRQARRGGAPQHGFIPRESAVPISAPEVAPARTQVAEATIEAAAQPVEQPIETVQPPAPAYSAPLTSPVLASEPATSRPLVVEPVIAPRVAAESSSAERVTAEPARPAPTPIIPRTGREAMIYVSLVGEGLNVLRSVKAEHVGRDFYRILEPVPEGETWEYQPGQIVRCKKKNLSSGKALVAIEEAPRAR